MQFWGRYNCTHVGDEVHPGHLLHHLATHAQKCPVEEPLRAVFEHRSERPLLRGCLLFDNGLGDIRDIKVDDRIVFGDMMGIRLDGPENMASFIVSVVRDELETLSLSLAPEGKSIPIWEIQVGE